MSKYTIGIDYGTLSGRAVVIDVKDGKQIGAIGVIGPLRMDYARVLSTLDGLTGNIVDLLSTTTALPAVSDENKKTQDKEK